MTTETPPNQSRKNLPHRNMSKGLLYAIAAFTLWGLAPVYFKAVVHVDEFEVLSHRILWSFVFLLLYIQIKGLWSALIDRPLRSYLPYVFSALLVSCNWLVFIWAVGQERILETSLGYFINPLVSVCLGMLFLKERLKRWQWVAVGLATLGVINQVLVIGTLPWIAIVLALSFGAYGLIRKVYTIHSILGLFIETLIVLPLALIYLVYLSQNGRLSFLNLSYSNDVLLILAGFVTSIPLLFFAAGTRDLSLKAMGMVQYIAPSMSFLLAIFVYQEPFDRSILISFCLIWLGLLVFTIDAFGARKSKANGRIKQ